MVCKTPYDINEERIFLFGEPSFNPELDKAYRKALRRSFKANPGKIKVQHYLVFGGAKAVGFAT
ncbi:MAG: hypothetical protein ACPLXP_01380 [Microgenomates group bacterium]